MADSNSSPTVDPDKSKLWGWWYKTKEWQDELHRQASYKALDIPDDMGNISAPKTTISKNGLGWPEMAVLTAAGLGGWFLYQRNAEPTSTPMPQPTAESVKATAEAEFRFWQRKADGTLVPVDIERLPASMRPTE